MQHVQNGIGQRYVRLIATALGLIAALPAQAAERSLSIQSFERIRVEGPFDVRLTTNRSPSARASGDASALEALDLRVEGNSLVVRSRAMSKSSERRRERRGVTIVTLATPRLVSATVIGGGALKIDGALTAAQLDLSLNGAGSLSVSAVATDQLNTTLTGTGKMTLAGRARRARLLLSGSGAVVADDLVAADLIIRTEGSGTARATARFTAQVTTSGLGEVTVLGTPTCTVKAIGGGPVTCGK